MRDTRHLTDDYLNRSVELRFVGHRDALQDGTLLEPLQDRVILDVQDHPYAMAKLILIPDQYQKQQRVGVVVAVGPGASKPKGGRTEMTLKVGDRVIYHHFGGEQWSVGNHEYRIIRERDVLAYIE